LEEYIDNHRSTRSPGRRRNIYAETGFGGWDVIDVLTVTRCARMPQGMHTAEFIPNSLQEEWVGARTDVFDTREHDLSREETQRALKWLLLLPHGLLHEPSRDGKTGNLQHRELAKRLVLWRQMDMSGLMKGLKLAALKA
jgi:hypothetical protein